MANASGRHSFLHELFQREVVIVKVAGIWQIPVQIGPFPWSHCTAPMAHADPFQLVFSNRHSFLCQDQSPRISVVANLKLSLVICVPERLLIRSGSSLPQGSTVGCRPLYNAFSDHVKRLRTRDIVWWDHNSAFDMENRRNLEARMLRGLQSNYTEEQPYDRSWTKFRAYCRTVSKNT